MKEKQYSGQAKDEMCSPSLRCSRRDYLITFWEYYGENTNCWMSWELRSFLREFYNSKNPKQWKCRHTVNYWKHSDNYRVLMPRWGLFGAICLRVEVHAIQGLVYMQQCSGGTGTISNLKVHCQLCCLLLHTWHIALVFHFLPTIKAPKVTECSYSFLT